MKKISTLFSLIVSLCCVLTVLSVSCSPVEEPDNSEKEDPKEPDEQVAEVADSLTTVLQRQIDAMSFLLTSEDLKLSSCSESTQEGLYEILFQGGKSFKLFSGVECGILAYFENDGEKTWASYDSGRTLSELKTESGNTFSLQISPLVKIVDGAYVLTFGDVEFRLDFSRESQVQAFDCDVLKDGNGEIYAVKFIFAEGLEKLVYLETYSGASFYLLGDDKKAALTEYCVNWGSTASFVLDIASGIEYKLEVSEDWKADVRVDGGNICVDIVAPEKGEDSSNEAIVTVLTSDGLFTLADLRLTTNPFNSLFASATSVVISPSAGVDKFVYGISLKEDFDIKSIQDMAEDWITGKESLPATCFISSEPVLRNFDEVLGGEIETGVDYVLWAATSLNLMSVEFSKITTDFEIVKTYLLDADVKVEVNGADAVFGGVVQKSDDAISEILYQVNESINDSIPAIDGKFIYEGVLSDFPAVDEYRREFEPATTYILWTVAAVTGGYQYTEADIFSVEVTTNDFQPGSDLKLVCSSAEVTPSTITVPVSCAGAEMICYAFLDNSIGTRYSTASDVDKMAQMKKASCTTVKAEEIVAKGQKLSPNTGYWLYATAIDKDGKYGPISSVKATTSVLEFDPVITLSVDQVDVSAKQVVLNVTSAGGDLSEYIYWFGRTTDPFWANTSYCGGTKTSAQRYMALNPDDQNIRKMMNKYGMIADNGTIVFNDLLMETEYVFVILEKGEKFYSKVGYKKVTTLAADLGEIVREGTPTWNTAKNAIKLEWIESRFQQGANANLMSSYAFNFKCPENLTAYVMCASVDYFQLAGFTKMEHIMIEIENYSSRRYANGYTPMINGALATEPDYVKNGEPRSGQLMNVYDFYVHGLPNMGFVTYFAKDSHGEDNCIYWKNDHCAQYSEYEASIAKFLTLEPYELKAEQYGLQGAEASAWAEDLLEAYSPYYKDAKPIIYENDGKGVLVSTPYATGVNEDGVIPDRVVVMLKDLQGNYYEPMYFEVPDYFE